MAEETTTLDQLQKDYPGVELAYPIAVASYETALKRIDAQEARTQALMAFAATLTVAIPAMTAGRGLTFRSPWFVLALSLFALANALGVYSRLHGTLKLLNPQVLFNHYLRCGDWEFKKEAIYHAGLSFTHNNELLFARQRLVIAMLVIFVLEVAVLSVWAAGALANPFPG